MPTTKSAAKRVRQNEKKRKRNKAVKTKTKNAKKRFFAALEEGDVEEAQERFREACRQLQKAAAKGVLHENKIARDQSRMQRRLNELQEESA